VRFLIVGRSAGRKANPGRPLAGSIPHSGRASANGNAGKIIEPSAYADLRQRRQFTDPRKFAF
jgi:hypothetical protein